MKALSTIVFSLFVAAATFAQTSKIAKKHTFLADSEPIVKMVPDRYKTIYDTIEIHPALNAAMDTSNYFVQAELIEIQDAGAEWIINNGLGQEDISMLVSMIKTPVEFQLIEKRFYPFKEILDVSKAENIIPAQVVIIAHQVKIQEAHVEYYQAKSTKNKAFSKKILSTKGYSLITSEKI